MGQFHSSKTFLGPVKVLKVNIGVRLTTVRGADRQKTFILAVTLALISVSKNCLKTLFLEIIVLIVTLLPICDTK